MGLKAVKYKVISDSMEPLIPVGAEIIVREYNGIDSLKKFDILLFSEGDRLICHYFWHENLVFDKGLIVTRSLNKMKEDIPFSRDRIIGIVVNFKLSAWNKAVIWGKELFK